jgi:thymidylate kinase
MRIVPIEMWNRRRPAVSDDRPIARLENPVLAKVMAERRSLLPQSQDQYLFHLARLARESRVLIVEGSSGSGKDTFQAYLKKLLKGQDVYDYSEGEVLHSWKQLQIKGVSEVRVRLMNLFANHIKETVSRDVNAVFLLNRFHLSTYASTIIQHPNLATEYDEIVNVLKSLPIHIFILQLDDNEIERRSLHPERSGAWQKFQQQIVDKHSFRDRLEAQQKLILEAAKRQQIPYSLMKLADEPELGNGRPRISKAPSFPLRGAGMGAANGSPSRRKRQPIPTGG